MAEAPTPERGYLTPLGDYADEDLVRIQAALNAIDADVAALILALAAKAAAGHGHVIGDIDGLTSALNSKASAAALSALTFSLGQLEDVDIEGALPASFLKLVGENWVPALLTISDLPTLSADNISETAGRLFLTAALKAAYDAAAIKANKAIVNDAADQAFTGGVRPTALVLATSGTMVINPSARPHQTINKMGATTFAGMAGNGDCCVEMTIGAAGGVSFTGFSTEGDHGDTIPTTVGHKCRIYFSRIGGSTPTYYVRNMQ